MGAVIVYVMVLAFIALRARIAREYEEFSVAKRMLPVALVFGGITATYVGPGFSIGFVDNGFRSGFLFSIVGLAYAVQNISVGLLIAPRLRALQGCYTLGDAIGQKYDRRCQILAGIISVGLCMLFAAVMINAGGKVVLQEMLGLPAWLSVSLLTVVAASYTTFGGLRASVTTDVFHFVLHALFLPPVLLYLLLFHFEGGAKAFFQQAASATATGFQLTSPLEVVSLVTLFLLGETLIPPYANLTLASKTSRVSRGSFILAGLFSALWFLVMISLGVVARTMVPPDTAKDHVLMDLVKATIPTVGYALLLVTLVSIVLSSLNSLLNAGATVLTQDLIRQFTHLPDRAALRTGRGCTILIAAVAAAAAMFVPSVIEGLMFCYSIWAPAILPAVIFGLWLPRPRPWAGLLSMMVGTLVAVAFKFPFFSQTGIPPILPALACSLLAYAAGHWAQGIHERAQAWT
ncbi:MAG: sodium:solute symporter family protein [Planctomycetes bacterium]|nr:sodium:solute symporter family protein [Planctomycetota bacterium]